MNYNIQYKNKKSEKEIINDIQNVKLKTIEKIGYAPNSNKLIKGENLLTLKSLYLNPEIKGKVKLVYIDPPYSTQKVFTANNIWYKDDIDFNGDEHAYEDRLKDYEYLEFIRRRLILIRELLSEDGSIYVHLDDKMAFSVKVLMDEVFGPANFVNWITRRKCSSKNYTKNQFGNITDYIMYYSKSKDRIWNRPYKEWEEKHAKKEYPYVEEETGRRFKKVPIYAPGERNGKTGEAWKGMMPPEGKHWFTSPENLDKLDEEGRIYWSSNGNPRKKVYLDESEGVPYTDLWMNFRDAHNQNVSITGYPTEKNEDMLKMIIEASSNAGDVVMDCFCGSGTTLAAAAKLNRKWIGIDSSELAINVSKKRLSEIVKPLKLSLLDKKEGFTIEHITVKE